MRSSLPARIILQSLLGILPCFLLDSIFLVPRGCAAEEASDRKIEELIEDLRSGRFETREAATRALKERLDAIPLLRKERRSVDLEVRRRADDILLRLERNRASRGLTKAKALGKASRPVQVADRLAVAAKYGANGEEGWESLTRFAEQLMRRTERSFPGGRSLRPHRSFPAGEFRAYVERIRPTEVAEPKITIEIGSSRRVGPRDDKERAAYQFMRATRGALLLRGEEISLGDDPISFLTCGMIAASGDVHLSWGRESLIVAGGDIKKATLFSRCILICDGDVEMECPPSGANIIVARGKVTCTHGLLQNCLVRSSGHTLRLIDGTTRRLDGASDPLAFVKFFELTDVGIDAEDLPPHEKPDARGVLLKTVQKDSLFAKGLRPGDRIIALEAKKTPTTEIFRRILRRKLAENEPTMTFTVRRSGTTLDVPIPMKD